MIDERYIDLVTAYLDDSLTPEERAEFNSLIRRGEIDIIDLKEMERLYQKTGDIPAPEPSRAMHSNFYRMLEKEKIRQQSTITARFFRFVETVRARTAWKTVAVACIALLIGILIGSLTTPFKNYHRLDELNSRDSKQTYQDPTDAIVTTQKALKIVAVNLNAGKKEIQKLAAFNEAQKKVNRQ